jgi:uncharacterized protein
VKVGLVAFLAGALFAVGLGVSGMTHPTKVLAFLDFAGDWDPSLAFVMGGGVLVNLAGFRWAARRGVPFLASSFSWPPAGNVDARLVLGSAVFGAGWGLGGFCPGPAIVSAVGAAAPVVAFVVAMLASMAIFDASAAPASSSSKARAEAEV